MGIIKNDSYISLTISLLLKNLGHSIINIDEH
jgi:hypothetical protein